MTGLVQMAGIFDDATALGQQAITFLKVIVLGGMYLMSIAWVWGQTKSIVKAAVAALGGAAVLALVWNMTAVRDKIGEDLKNPGAAPTAVVRVVDLDAEAGEKR
ncbi:hypothetical protein AB0I82_35905 [Streptomyces sp. NPDC050315]|uniref:hypothetical protein n=1 Tax=Streptomyces sp. NPDC050315 TaxID=3155039 RepID=UPI00341C7C22